MKLLLVDNYDSFTYNLREILISLGAQIDTVRNDKIDLSSLEEYHGLVLSPGPGLPSVAGDLKEIIRRTYRSKPILGVCLGMQAIAEVMNCELELMDQPLHGFETELIHFKHPLFNNVPERFKAGRYHSWRINAASLNENVEVIAKDGDGHVMGIHIKGSAVFGFQFHPESIMTEYGNVMMANFLTQIKENETIIK